MKWNSVFEAEPAQKAGEGREGKEKKNQKKKTTFNISTKVTHLKCSRNSERQTLGFVSRLECHLNTNIRLLLFLRIRTLSVNAVLPPLLKTIRAFD